MEERVPEYLGSTERVRSSARSSAHWSSVEEGLLQAIVEKANLPARSTTRDWEKIAAALARSGEALGLSPRSASACRNKARSMGLIASREKVTPQTQGSFAPVELRNALADALERVAKELRVA